MREILAAGTLIGAGYLWLSQGFLVACALMAVALAGFTLWERISPEPQPDDDEDG